MRKKILITGASDGIGLVSAKMMVEQGHHVLLHGRNKEKLHKMTADFADPQKTDN
ncbi:MAG: SDR family NAD(P)-dependent oxidoreductase, partial [Pseudomonadota bacterium]